MKVTVRPGVLIACVVFCSVMYAVFGGWGIVIGVLLCLAVTGNIELR